MEIKAELLQPYTEDERANFIIKQNYELGYEIRESEDSIQSWGFTEEESEELERERIAKLTCTKRVLVLMLEELGLDYFNQIQPLIEANRQAKLEWELASELLRSNPLLDVVGKELGISSEQLDRLFQYANGEVDTLKEVDNG